MNSRYLETLMQAVGANPRDTDQVTRSLRASGDLPVGGRGPNAPRIGANEAANIILAYAATDTHSRAAEALTAVHQLERPNNVESRYSHKFHEAVCTILNSSEVAKKISEVLVCRSHPMAIIKYEDGTKEKFINKNSEVFTGGKKEELDYFGEAVIRVDCRLSRGLLKQISFLLEDNRDDPEMGEIIA